MKRMFGWMALLIMSCQLTEAQDVGPPVGGPGGPGGGVQGVGLSLSASENDVPIGTIITVTASHDPLTSPSYLWDATCVTNFSIFPWELNAAWQGATITDCFGSAGTRRYRVMVSGTNANNQGASETGEIDVTFHAPDQYTVSIAPVTIDNSYGDFGWEQWQYIGLLWDGEDLGTCANVCCQEKVKTTHNSAHPTLSFLDKDLDWWPTCAEQSGGTVTGLGANEASWIWLSPNLSDMQWVYWTAAVNSYVNGLADGTVLATKVHQYKFTGSECPSGNWVQETTLNFELVVAGTVPNKYPEWRETP